MYTLRNRSKSSNNSSCNTLWIFQSPRWQSLPQYCATEHFTHFFNSVLAKQNQHNSLHFCVKLGICTPYLAAMNLRILMSYKFSLGQNRLHISKTNFCSIFSSCPSFSRGIFSMGAEPLCLDLREWFESLGVDFPSNSEVGSIPCLNKGKNG